VIRIVLAEVSGLTADFLRLAIAKQPKMRIVKELPSGSELERALQTVETDVVVTKLSSAAVPPTYHGLVFRIPPVAVVAIGADRRQIEVYNGTVIPEVALEQLVSVIRDLVGPRVERLTATGSDA
jgi:hypothetical protein